jgi:hypothetical protein
MVEKLIWIFELMLLKQFNNFRRGIINCQVSSKYVGYLREEKVTMNFKKMILCVALFLTTMFQMVFAASPKGTVNVLTWWDYLNSPEITTIIKKKCNVTLYHDEYYCNSEFLTRFSSNKSFYDIIIFPRTVYELIKEKIAIKNSTLSKVTKKYNNCVREHYLSYNYPNNIVFFVLSFTGFIWNPATINLSASDSSFSMFNKAKDGIVVIANDPVGVENLTNRQMLHNLFIEKAKNNREASLKENSFKQIVQDTTIYITNGYNKLYDNDKFAFAFQRSGEAVFAIKTSKKTLNFLMHPNYSYVSPDLLAELNTRPETQCVAKTLASKEVSDIMQKKSYYLSPYGTYKLVDDNIFQKVYKQLHNICEARWLESISTSKYVNLLKKWDDIAILPQILKGDTTFARPQF